MAELLKADGFDRALLGVSEVWAPDGTRQARLVYDGLTCIQILMERDGMTQEEAEEYMDFNVLGAYVGPATPIFVFPRTEE